MDLAAGYSLVKSEPQHEQTGSASSGWRRKWLLEKAGGSRVNANLFLWMQPSVVANEGNEIWHVVWPLTMECTPSLCAADKAKTDVTTSVWFGVDVVTQSRSTAYTPRTFASDTRGIITERCCLCLRGEKRREGLSEQTRGLEPLWKFSQIPLLFFALVLSHHVPAHSLLTLSKMEKQKQQKKSVLSFREKKRDSFASAKELSTRLDFIEKSPCTLTTGQSFNIRRKGTITGVFHWRMVCTLISEKS